MDNRLFVCKGECVVERESTETKEVMITSVLFPDHTAIVGSNRNMNESVRRVKEVMNRWEERLNEDRKERLRQRRESR